MKESPSLTNVLQEQWHHAEYVDEEGNYQRVKWRTVERFGFFIRPFRSWFFPCTECQANLKKLALDSNWILGNQAYEPLVELNRDFKEIDDDSWVTLETHKATKEELKRIDGNNWNYLPLKDAK